MKSEAMDRDITEHQRAEDALHEAHEQLEERVKEHTEQLEERVKETEQLNRIMTNLLEDLQATNSLLVRTGRELALANEELGAFSYTVSHDLRAPLWAIILANGMYDGRNDETHPKVILLDLKLPKVDGLEVLRRVRSDENTRLILVVVLTYLRKKSKT